MGNHCSVGIMAHVDAGKTTLSEGLLYVAGRLRETGRVDHGDAFLDTYALEKERGITIFSKEAVLPWGTLIDTPGHVDFAPEAERVLSILDYAILVISGTDGVQGHTRTLWRLLREYDVPVFLFVNKTDQPGADRERLIGELHRELDDACIDFSRRDDDFFEEVSMTDEAVMETYLETGTVEDAEFRRLISERKLFPVYFGSALKLEGVEEFYHALETYCDETPWVETDGESRGGEEGQFAARVYKISRDEKGTRLTHIRVLNGTLRPRQEITMSSKTSSDTVSEKVDQIRRCDGVKFELLTEAGPGTVCALTGLKETFPGQGLGGEPDMEAPLLAPVLNYELILPAEVPAVTFLPKIRELEEEQPELHVAWEESRGAIHVQVMGEVQTEILQSLIAERYGVSVTFGQAQVVYRETVTKAVEGIGHYEPLKHYAEAHIAIEPGEPGSGIVVGCDVSTDVLDLNWQRLIVTHLIERDHPGVRIGAPLTDVRLTVIGGRAHLKHTEGGDFRQATYRAVRHGLMQADCRVLEPYYEFRLTVPQTQVGRAMTDIERMCGTFTLEESGAGAEGQSTSTLAGQAPVVTMQDYPREVAAYTGGQRELSLSFFGYLPCHNEEEIVEAAGYDPEADEANPPGSVFCAHGAGYYVPWNEVAEQAHVQTGWQPEAEPEEEETPEIRRLRRMDEALGVEEIDAILDRAGNSNRRAPRRSLRRAREKTVRRAAKPSGAAKPRKSREKIGDYLLVDGYNVIHAWPELAALAKEDMEQARGRLQDILCDYQGFRGGDVILVFDAYRVAGHPTEIFDYHNIHVVYTKTAETADRYIERFSVEKADRYHVTVVTSDGLEQIIIRGAGAHLLSAGDLAGEIAHVREGAAEILLQD